MATRSFPKASLKKNRFRTLAIESLEYRQMLSATSLIGAAGRLDGLESVRVSPFAYDATTRKLIINGDDGVNLASVSIDDHGTTSPLDDEVVASISSGSQTDTFRIQLISDPATMTPSVHDVVFNGYAGDDTFTNLTSINSEAHGGVGNDNLNGGSGYNCLYGDPGFDTLRAGYQGDYLDGGADADQIFGDIGADTIYGRDGDDLIDAGNGRNYVDGGIGNDSIKCGIGNDIILGLDVTIRLTPATATIWSMAD
jgi:Ca2+-binding RTX toxin-like protein